MDCVFLEIVIQAAEAADRGLDSRDEIEGPLEDALAEAGVGEIVGGGGGSGVYLIEVEVLLGDLESILDLIRSTLGKINVPPTTLIKTRGGDSRVYSIYS